MGVTVPVFLLLANFRQISTWKYMISSYAKDFSLKKKKTQVRQILNFFFPNRQIFLMISSSK
jgi:hypothetical protein